MHEEIYGELAEHLDRLPGGFGSRLALHLSLDRESAGEIAARAGLAPHEAEQRLATMALKGLIMTAERRGRAPPPGSALCGWHLGAAAES